MRAYGLYTHIRENQWRSLFLIIVLPIILYIAFFGMGYSLWVIKRISSIPYTPPPTAEGLEYKEVQSVNLSTGQDVVLKVPQRQKYFFRTLRKIFSFDKENKEALRVIGILVAACLIAWMCIALLIEDILLFLESGRHVIRQAKEPELWNILENLCMSRGIPMPKLNVMETSVLNAFAFGYSQDTYGITVTRGLIENLSKEEMEAVMAHELTHIRNGDVSLMMIATLMVGIFVFLAERVMTVQEERMLLNHMKERRLRGIFLFPLLFPLYLIVFIGKTSSLFIKAVLSQKRDYLADAGAVELTSNPNSLISALEKVGGNSDILGATSGLMTMCLNDPRSRSWFDARPSLFDRIKALKQYAGGTEHF